MDLDPQALLPLAGAVPGDTEMLLDEIAAEELLEQPDLPDGYEVGDLMQDVQSIDAELAVEETALPSKDDFVDALVAGGLDRESASQIAQSMVDSVSGAELHADFIEWADREYKHRYERFQREKSAILVEHNMQDTGDIANHHNVNPLTAPILFLGTYPVVGYGGLEDTSNFTMAMLDAKGITAAIEARHISFCDLHNHKHTTVRGNSGYPSLQQEDWRDCCWGTDPQELVDLCYAYTRWVIQFRMAYLQDGVIIGMGKINRQFIEAVMQDFASEGSIIACKASIPITVAQQNINESILFSRVDQSFCHTISHNDASELHAHLDCSQPPSIPTLKSRRCTFVPIHHLSALYHRSSNITSLVLANEWCINFLMATCCRISSKSFEAFDPAYLESWLPATSPANTSKAYHAVQYLIKMQGEASWDMRTISSWTTARVAQKMLRAIREEAFWKEEMPHLHASALRRGSTLLHRVRFVQICLIITTRANRATALRNGAGGSLFITGRTDPLLGSLQQDMTWQSHDSHATNVTALMSAPGGALFLSSRADPLLGQNQQAYTLRTAASKATNPAPLRSAPEGSLFVSSHTDPLLGSLEQTMDWQAGISKSTTATALTSAPGGSLFVTSRTDPLLGSSRQTTTWRAFTSHGTGETTLTFYQGGSLLLTARTDPLLVKSQQGNTWRATTTRATDTAVLKAAPGGSLFISSHTDPLMGSNDQDTNWHNNDMKSNNTIALKSAVGGSLFMSSHTDPLLGGSRQASSWKASTSEAIDATALAVYQGGSLFVTARADPFLVKRKQESTWRTNTKKAISPAALRRRPGASLFVTARTDPLLGTANQNGTAFKSRPSRVKKSIEEQD